MLTWLGDPGPTAAEAGGVAARGQRHRISLPTKAHVN